ncbi:MAG: putative periplasmic lipoprotein [Candidatus Eisenbacteria bacterium]
MRLPTSNPLRLALLLTLLLVSLTHAQTGPTAADSLVSAVAFPAPQVRAWQVGLLRSDRMVHAGFSFTLMTALGLATRDRRTGAALTLAAGLGKELWDMHPGGSGFDWTDLAADATGTALGTAVVGTSPR